MANDLLIKYKVSDLARDLGQPAKQVIDELAAVTGETKKPGANLSKEELNLVMDQLTKGAQEQDLTAYFESEQKSAPVKAEKKAAPKAAEKPAAPAAKEEAVSVKKEEPKQEAQPAEPPAPQKAEKGGVFGIVIGLIALIAILAYAWMNPMGKTVDTGILYTKEDNLYYYDLKNEPYQVQEGLSNGGTYHYFYTAWGASVTEDGSYLYFSDDVDENGAFVLYRKDAKNADAAAAQIDTDVYDYMASKDGKVVAYLKKSGETYALCVYDGKEVQTVKTGVNLENDVYALSGNGKYLAFTDTTGLLNAVAVGKNMEDNILPLTDSAETYAMAEESGILYYVAAGKDGYNIFSYDFKGEPKTAVENVSSMEMMPNGRDVLYCKKSDEEVLYKDIIVDDMAEQDAKLKKGDEGYDQKVQRDEIRKAMKNGEGFEPLLQECYVLIGGKSVLVTGNAVAAVGVSGEQSYVTGYRAKEFTPMHLSVMDGGLDMVEYIYYMSLNYGGMEVFLADTTGKVNLLSGSQPQLDGLKLSENGKKAAYLDTDANTGDTVLVEMELGKEKAETVATNVQSFGYIGNTLIYYFDYTEGVGTLGAAGSKTTIANASGVQFTEDAVYYVADADEASGNGELRAWDGKTETALAKDVFAFQYKDNGKLVYIGSYDVNAGVGDLYYYDGKEARKLDTGITAIFIY